MAFSSLSHRKPLTTALTKSLREVHLPHLRGAFVEATGGRRTDEDIILVNTGRQFICEEEDSFVTEFRMREEPQTALPVVFAPEVACEATQQILLRCLERRINEFHTGRKRTLHCDEGAVFRNRG